MSESTYKNRITLTLAQRVQVIREYDLTTPKPKIQEMAYKYNVSFPQIKKILANRDAILNSYFEAGGDNVHEELHDELVRQRQEKIEFLGKVMFEYIERAMQQNLSLDDENVLLKAIEINDCIAVANFRPTVSWLNEFKTSYNIPSFDLKTMQNNVTLKEPKRLSLSPIDLITHVTGVEKKKRKYGKRNHKRTAQSALDIPTRSSSPPPLYYPNMAKITCTRISSEDSNGSCQQPTIVDVSSYPPLSPVESGQGSTDNERCCQSCSERDIKSVEDALKHLRLLEEYAMLQDNFRAIGLLTQLEDVFKKPVNED